MERKKKGGWAVAAALALGFILAACAGEGGGQAGPSDPPATPAPSADTTVTVRKPGFTEDYLNADRGIWQKPDLVIDLLGTLTGKTVADIGAGSGFFAMRLLEDAEKVIAIDIDPRFIEYLDSLKATSLPESQREKLETRLATPDDPKLQPGEADIVIIVNTYMYIKDRVAYLRNLRQGIAEGGTLLIVDFKKKRTPLGPPSSFRIPLYQVEEELFKAGYSEVATNDTALDYQYIIISEK